MAKLIHITTSNVLRKQRLGAVSPRGRWSTAEARSEKAHRRVCGALRATPSGLDCTLGAVGRGPVCPEQLPLLAAAPPALSFRGAGSGPLSGPTAPRLGPAHRAPPTRPTPWAVISTAVRPTAQTGPAFTYSDDIPGAALSCSICQWVLFLLR